MTRTGANRFPFYLCVVAAVLLALVAGATADATTRIVPLGDSITKGMLHTDDGASHPTYRYWLWQKLRSNGYDVDFVGSWSEPNFPGYSFDQQNEGHGGYTIGGILNGVPDDPSHYLSTWLRSYTPDVALVVLGTNDVLANTAMSTRFSNLNGVVQTLRSKNPKIRIFIAKLPPTGDSYRNTNSGLITFNNQLPGWVSARSTTQSPITVVDLYSGYDGRADNQAGRYIHPDESGERKIADRFYAAITPYLSKGGTSTPTPTPTPYSFAISGARTLDRPGSYYLTRDIINSDENICIEVTASDVTIDGKGYRIDGLGQADMTAIAVSSGAKRVTIRNVRLTDWAYGVIFRDENHDGRVEGCTIEGASWGGVVLFGSDRITVTGNRVTGTQFGIYVGESTGTTVYNNRFSTPTNAYLYGETASTTWSVTKRAGPNVIGGASIGGNYWGSPDGTGFSETRVDANRDGFIDEPYTVGNGQRDLLPLAASTAPTGTPTPAPTPGPYPAAHAVPGTVEAEDYNVGGFSDTTPANEGGAYRTDAVDIESGGSNYNVGWIRAGEYLEYSVDATAARAFDIGFRVANAGPAKTVTVRVNGAARTLTIPVTGGLQAWQTATLAGVNLAAGRNLVRVEMGSAASFNFDSMQFVASVATPSPTPTITQTPTATPTASVTPTPNVTPPAGVVAVPPGSDPPTDTDDDGRYDDTNGNGRADFADVVLYFNQMSWIAENEPLEAFDYNGNGRVDFADVTWLFNTL